MSDIDVLDITPATEEQQSSYIKVIGVGGAGTNAVNHMYRKGITGVDFIVCNTDKQSLDASPVNVKIKLGDKDLGAGNDPSVGQQAAAAAADRIKAVLDNNTHMLFIAAGMGGGTGTGASPEIAKIAKEIEVDEGKSEILVVAVVTTPFSFEGQKRRVQAMNGIEKLREVVDSVIIVNTDKLKNKGNMSMPQAFALADDVLLTAAKGISEIMTANAYIHVDFRDVQSVMQHSGVALMGSGIGEGEDRAYEAIKAATASDLLNDNDLSGTKNMLLYVSCSSKEEYVLQMDELDTITHYIEELASPDVDKIWGYGYDDSLEGKVAVTLVATGFQSKDIYKPPTREPEVKPNMLEKPTTVKLEEPKSDINPNRQRDAQNNPQIAEPIYTEPEKKIQDIAKTFTLSETKTEDSPVSVMAPPQTAPKEITRIKLGETISETPVKSAHIPEKKDESKESILREFARTDNKDDKSLFDDEMEITFEKPSTASLFAPSANKELDSLFASRQQQQTPKITLKDTVNTYNTSSKEANAFIGSQSVESKTERIKRINQLLKSGNADFIESIRPTIDNIDEKLSMARVPDTRMSVSKDGTVSIVESPIIGSSVD